MNFDHLHYVVRCFPRIFHGRYPVVRRTIPVGWYNVVDDLLKALDKFLTEKEANSFEVIYIAERSGVLQFVFESRLLPAREKAIDELIRVFVAESAVTCRGCSLQICRVAENSQAQLCLVCQALGLENSKLCTDQKF